MSLFSPNRRLFLQGLGLAGIGTLPACGLFRESPKPPVIALVLGSGAARGFAHIGVIGVDCFASDLTSLDGWPFPIIRIAVSDAGAVHKHPNLF